MIRATTILSVRHHDRTVMAGDGQVTFGSTVLKQNAKKIRRLYNDSILAGFAGSAADSFALFSRFEAKLEQYRGNLERSAVELARDWRTDRLLRRLEAMLIVSDKRATFSMNLDNPVELLRELEERAPFEFRVRDTRSNQLILDVDDDAGEGA